MNSNQNAPKASRSMSAEEQWLKTVVKPNAKSQRFKVPPIHDSNSQNVDVLFGNDAPRLSRDEADAEQRMVRMQKEIDQVIGVMQLNFEDECGVSPDKRMSEIFHASSSQYKRPKCTKKAEELNDDKFRRKTLIIQTITIVGVFLIILAFLVLDGVLTTLVVKNEADEMLEDGRLRVLKKNQTEEVTLAMNAKEETEKLSRNGAGAIRGKNDNAPPSAPSDNSPMEQIVVPPPPEPHKIVHPPTEPEKIVPPPAPPESHNVVPPLPHVYQPVHVIPPPPPSKAEFLMESVRKDILPAGRGVMEPVADYYEEDKDERLPPIMSYGG